MKPDSCKEFFFKKNTWKSFLRKFDDMPQILIKNRFIIAILSALVLLLGSSCKKTILEQISTATLQSYFEDNILNKNFIVNLATDSSVDRTNQYDGYIFVLSKTNSFIDGPMTATKAGVTYTGTWSSNDDYGKLIISITSPAPPPVFAFLNRSWKFVKKDLPVMQLAPWGTTDPKVLHMRRL